MPIFIYEAKNQKGQVVTGEVSSDSQDSAEKILAQNRLGIVSLKRKETNFLANLFGQRVGVHDKAVFARQLATMLGAGFPLMQALSVIALQTTNPKMKTVTASLIADLEAGNYMSAAMQKFPEVFSDMFVSIIQSGEASGKLPKVLGDMADELEKENAFLGKIRGALYYPGFICLVMIIIAVLMMVKVIPELKKVFEEANAKLPLVTRGLIGLSDFMAKWWWAVFFIVLPLIYLGLRQYGRTREGKRTYDKLKISIPIIGKLNKLIYMARFTRTFGLLTLTGIPILEAIRISSATINNVIYATALREVYEQVEKGAPISVPLSRDPNFPPMVSQMVGVGEKTGKLDEILEGLAHYYENEADEQVKNFTSLLEPILIVIIGFAVALMVFAIIMPIYSIAQIGG